MIADVFGGRRVLLTGHTGFKGAWLSLWLTRLGARVHGLSLPPPTTPSLFDVAGIDRVVAEHTVGDVRDLAVVSAALARAEPDLVFHLAAQPLVREGYRAPVDTFGTNVLGTVNVLEAVRAIAPKAAVVVVTSDKCYAEADLGRGYREDDRLGGRDPYSASKAAAELVAGSYRDSFALRVATVRAGNVFGGGDWARDRIVVDAVQAIVAGRPVSLRNPRSTRPFQHVLEALHGYLSLASRLLTSDDPTWASAWNFGPEGETAVAALVDTLCRLDGSASAIDASEAAAPHEAPRLALDSTRARRELGWSPRWSLEHALEVTLRWYRAWHAGAPMLERCQADLDAYGELESSHE